MFFHIEFTGDTQDEIFVLSCSAVVKSRQRTSAEQSVLVEVLASVL